MKKLSLAFILLASPAFASMGLSFSLSNTNFIVLLSFLLFVGVLMRFKVPHKLVGLLDARAAQIKTDLEEARALRDEAKAILGSYDRKQKEMYEQSERIVRSAREEATTAAKQAKADLKLSIARRLASAEERIATAEAAAVREVRETAVNVAVSAAADLLSTQITAKDAAASIDDAINQVRAKLH
ncbi:MAG: F-type H+-transporting ATPase subunit b [Paracoccaceae bacterium]|jgi:F-type H+-transporting ATPase subunit b